MRLLQLLPAAPFPAALEAAEAAAARAAGDAPAAAAAVAAAAAALHFELLLNLRERLLPTHLHWLAVAHR